MFRGFSSRRQPTMITNAPMMVLVFYFVLSLLDMRVGAGLHGVMAAPAQVYSHVERTNMRTSFFRHSVPENLSNSDLEREVESTIRTDKVRFHALSQGIQSSVSPARMKLRTLIFCPPFLLL
ncbi:hypothetical protein GGU11DRAFT_803790 [Lentinula aff. detonsa]|nr:hypothetical protein GGU11DRAFT_803790 [Lentinula aff. detonsa]